MYALIIPSVPSGRPGGFPATEADSTLGGPRARHRDGGILGRAGVMGQRLHPAGWKGRGRPGGLS